MKSPIQRKAEHIFTLIILTKMQHGDCNALDDAMIEVLNVLNAEQRKRDDEILEDAARQFAAQFDE